MTSAPSASFPRLRQDLTIARAPADSADETIFVLTDLVRHKFFQFGQSQIDEIAMYSGTNIAGPDEPTGLADFLAQNELVAINGAGQWKGFSEKAKRAKQGFLTAALHGYLYFRIPLFNPTKILQTFWPVVRYLFNRGFFIATFIAFLVSILIISRHWEQFYSNFASLYSVSGLMIYAMVFAGIKSFHEAGHAFVAHRFGIAVPTVGIAFMMFAPVLYTETSAAWRLNKRARLYIGAAGMITEIIIAAWASLLWVFVPDGTLRSILFAIATTGWFLTLAVNLNPLMRFDGYFLASDLVSIPNLSDRSFAMARWGLRELLFKSGVEKPEEFSSFATIALIIFAIATWIYRLFLYLGIALLVYHFAVKLLGIFLFLVEIYWFILKPITHEVAFWWKNKQTYLTTIAARKSAIIFLALIALLLLPISRTLTLPALLTAQKTEALHTKVDAQISKSYLVEGKQVSKGDVLIELNLHDLDREASKANAAISLAKTKLARLASDAESKSQRRIFEQEMERALEKMISLDALSRNKLIIAPFDGVVVNLEPSLIEGRWISPQTLLAIIKGTQGVEIHAIARDVEVTRIEPAAQATFYPDMLEHIKLPASLRSIESTGSAQLAFPDFADVNGGSVTTMRSPNGQLTPKFTFAKLLLSTPDTNAVSNHMERGVVIIDATPESIAAKILRRIAAVLIVESGF